MNKKKRKRNQEKRKRNNEKRKRNEEKRKIKENEILAPNYRLVTVTLWKFKKFVLHMGILVFMGSGPTSEKY